MSKTVLGIDGCRAGWVVTVLNQDSAVVQFYSTIVAILDKRQSMSSWIDIPIGLSDENKLRTIDQSARRLLPASIKSSLFSPPSRPALSAKDYREACLFNMKIEGKKLSRQSWNIAPKIGEVDHFLRHHPAWMNYLVESHPELCFYYLNHQKALNNKKKTSAGLLERLSILSSYFTHLEEVYHQVLADTRRSDIQKDDILDSMVLAVAALLSQEKNQHVITDANSADRLDVPIGIYYYQPTTTSL